MASDRIKILTIYQSLTDWPKSPISHSAAIEGVDRNKETQKPSTAVFHDQIPAFQIPKHLDTETKRKIEFLIKNFPKETDVAPDDCKATLQIEKINALLGKHILNELGVAAEDFKKMN
ncbi:hypothetical protein N9A67_03925 [Rhodobacteraceae bacterium]|nr:hypothetical protein [Paracoccaceae bacterium]